MTEAARDLYQRVVVPGLDLIEDLSGPVRLRAAEVLLVAISGQEAGWTAQRQSGGGPAHGLWQFERGGGVTGVLAHPASHRLARALCEHLGIYPTAKAVHEALSLSGDMPDLLDCGFARLLLWTDPLPLPKVGDRDGAWRYYLRTWRPGRPHPDRWQDNYRAAIDVCDEAT